MQERLQNQDGTYEGMSSDSRFTFVLLGCFLIFSDAPFLNARSLFVVYRTNRKRWAFGMCFYIMVQALCYYGVILLTTVIGTAIHGFAGNVWSTPMNVLVNYAPKEAFVTYGIEFPKAMLLDNWQPVGAMLHTLLLVVLYGVILAMVQFVINLNFHKIVGSLCAMGLHFLGFFIIGEGMMMSPKYSLLVHAMLNLHVGEVTLISSYMIFGILCAALWSVLLILSQFSDFKISIGGKLL